MCNAQLAVFFHETGIVLEISMIKLSVFSSFLWTPKKTLDARLFDSIL